MTNSPLYDVLMRHLAESRGRLDQVAADSGVPIGTLRKIAFGHIKNPRIQTVEKLARHFAVQCDFSVAGTQSP